MDEAALLEGLAGGKIAGLGIDVYSVEPPKKKLLRSLLARDEVVATPTSGPIPSKPSGTWRSRWSSR